MMGVTRSFAGQRVVPQPGSGAVVEVQLLRPQLPKPGVKQPLAGASPEQPPYAAGEPRETPGPGARAELGRAREERGRGQQPGCPACDDSRVDACLWGFEV